MQDKTFYANLGSKRFSKENLLGLMDRISEQYRALRLRELRAEFKSYDEAIEGLYEREKKNLENLVGLGLNGK